MSDLVSDEYDWRRRSLQSLGQD